tara:strand:+ start:95269 stop:95697 length:429 start_codon:yes stop_codon:yes gene_type:complete
MTLLLEIVTPDGRAYSERVDSVVLPTEMGEVGILPGHIPLTTKLVPGELQVMHEGKPQSLAVDKGFVQVSAEKVAVLTEAAIQVEDIDIQEVLEAQRRAREALEEAKKEHDMNPAEIETLEAFIRFTAAQQKAKEKKRRDVS